VTGHHRLLETNPALRRLIEMRNPYIDPINILQVGGLGWWSAAPGSVSACVRGLLKAHCCCLLSLPQVEVLRRARADAKNPRLREALLITINGIAAGMRNTG
jgi:phosphoenolpyruvate carboxylase